MPIMALAPFFSTRLSPSHPLTFQSTFSNVVVIPSYTHCAGFASPLLLPVAFRRSARLPTASLRSMLLPLTTMESG